MTSLVCAGLLIVALVLYLYVARAEHRRRKGGPPPGPPGR